MNIGAELPYRRSRMARRTGSLIFDRQSEDRVREHEQGKDAPMRIWSHGRFRSN